MGSFKLRLVTYFVLLALVPLLAASWAFSEVATKSELANTDARLNAALRVAVRDYAQTLGDDAEATALDPGDDAGLRGLHEESRRHFRCST